MSTSHIRCLLAVSFLVTPWAWGAAHGIFPGLASLIASSESIVVVSVESGPAAPRTHSYSSRAVQTVRVLAVLKGDAKPQDELSVWLDSEILFPTSTHLAVADFPVFERYVLFIVKESALFSRRSTMLNAQGSAFWIPRAADLSILKPADARGNIRLLLDEVRKYSELQQKGLDEGVREYLED